jgi:hypothetical protein
MRGGQWQVLYLLGGLRDQGHDAMLLARRDSPLLEAARAGGFNAAPLTPWAIARFSRSCDVVHAHDARTHSLAAIIAADRLVVSRRVAFPPRRSAASGWKYNRARHYAAISHYVAERLIEAGVREDRISVVFDGAPSMPERRAGATEFIAPASDDPMKGAALTRQAAELAGIPVRFTSNLLGDLPGARALVYISRSEGLGSAALLAMSCGVPVIASRVGGLPEAVEHEVTGLLVRNDASEIAAAMRAIAADAPLAARMGSAARARAAERFSVNAMVEGIVACYRKTAS